MRWMMLAGALLMGGCGGGDDAAWALQHGSVDAARDGISGYQVWEFYGRKWAKKRDEKHHLCARVQEISGTPEALQLEGCDDCDLVFRMDLAELETDCGADLASAAGYGGLTHFAFGPLPGDLDGEDPHPGDSFAWYQSWDGETAQLLGWAYDERLDRGDDPAGEGWTVGGRYVLWPAYAWEL